MFAEYLHEYGYLDRDPIHIPIISFMFLFFVIIGLSCMSGCGDTIVEIERPVYKVTVTDLNGNVEVYNNVRYVNGRGGWTGEITYRITYFDGTTEEFTKANIKSLKKEIVGRTIIVSKQTHLRPWEDVGRKDIEGS